MRAAGGDVVLWVEDFPLLYFCLFGWELFVEEREERGGVTMEYPLFLFIFFNRSSLLRP